MGDTSESVAKVFLASSELAFVMHYYLEVLTHGKDEVSVEFFLSAMPNIRSEITGVVVANWMETLQRTIAKVNDKLLKIKLLRKLDDLRNNWKSTLSLALDKTVAVHVLVKLAAIDKLMEIFNVRRFKIHNQAAELLLETRTFEEFGSFLRGESPINLTADGKTANREINRMIEDYKRSLLPASGKCARRMRSENGTGGGKGETSWSDLEVGTSEIGDLLSSAKPSSIAADGSSATVKSSGRRENSSPVLDGSKPTSAVLESMSVSPDPYDWSPVFDDEAASSGNKEEEEEEDEMTAATGSVRANLSQPSSALFVVDQTGGASGDNYYSSDEEEDLRAEAFFAENTLKATTVASSGPVNRTENEVKDPVVSPSNFHKTVLDQDEFLFG